ncbi:MAG: hypothetical protein IPP56_10935 [Bacteroidetes bacterium]|nr:hypothetical protein [Bacteroidota bacterium]MBK9672584.1 hypothetical protein [Bacteroidota bacterium]MBK9800188.1 hypothetical protein [Bacteroidota bacterium]MBP6412418.1 hypothetical protein [Bacteroidia bacterium]
MKTIISKIAFILCVLLISSKANAQCDTIANACVKNLTNQYISDGQQYRALLLDKEVAEFHATFYGGSQYRIAACSGLTDGNLTFELYDKERNLLFSNADQMNSPYWDFKFTNTMDVTMEAKLNKTSSTSGCAVLLISFKQ